MRPGKPYPATFRRFIKWSHRESNPNFQPAELTSFLWTIIPEQNWTGRGIEPRSPGCKPSVFPLDEPPMYYV